MKKALTFTKRILIFALALTVKTAQAQRRSATDNRNEPNRGELQSTNLRALMRGGTASALQDDRCQQGFVWREAFDGDHVCVTPEVRQQAADDNSHATERIDPQNPGFCIQGYVWREASPTDHVCVTPAVRAQAAADNQAAGSRVAYSMSGVTGALRRGVHPNDTDVEIAWRRGANGSHPPNAVLGGFEKYEMARDSNTEYTEGPLYVCRASFGGGLYLGKIVKDACNFAADGKEQRASRYEVMTWRAQRDSLSWTNGNATPPPGALAGGKSPGGQDLYLCRAFYWGGIHPGWQVPGTNSCSIGYGGEQIQRSRFFYLVPQRGKSL